MDALSRKVILVKYGGNAMTNESLQKEILSALVRLRQEGYPIVMVHGGGPFIQTALKQANITSEFVDGHRKTTPEAMKFVEMALKGEVNANLVSMLNALGAKAVGLSGKDGAMVRAIPRKHFSMLNGKHVEVDLGRVGDVQRVDASLLRQLLQQDYFPVVACVADDANGNTYNINADMFAGHLAGALEAERLLVLTDVDGLRKDKDDPASLIPEMKSSEMEIMIGQGILQGGMIPKIEACCIAVENGAAEARIINGTEPAQLGSVIEGKNIGTVVRKG